MPTDPTIQLQLLTLARAALEARVRSLALPSVPLEIEVDGFGVFVTIYHRGDLRGCLGSLQCQNAIVSAVARLAASVARDDYRFSPLMPHELAATTIDLSVLSPPEEICGPMTIEIGRHGLIVEQGSQRGLLLPQVATEHGWDGETFLAHTCRKAGLPTTAWLNGATVYRFEAEVFGEDIRTKRK